LVAKILPVIGNKSPCSGGWKLGIIRLAHGARLPLLILSGATGGPVRRNKSVVFQSLEYFLFSGCIVRCILIFRKQ